MTVAMAMAIAMAMTVAMAMAMMTNQQPTDRRLSVLSRVDRFPPAKALAAEDRSHFSRSMPM